MSTSTTPQKLAPGLKRPDATNKARRLMKKGYVIDSIQSWTGWGCGILYWTKFINEAHLEKILPLAQAFFNNHGLRPILDTYRANRLREKRSNDKEGDARYISTVTKAQEKQSYDKERDARYNSTVNNEKSTRKHKNNQDELAEEYQKKGYLIVEISGQQGIKSWCQYETSLALPNDPGSVVKLWLSFSAFKSEAEKHLLLEYRISRRRQLSNRRKSSNVTDAAPDPVNPVKIGIKRVPDARFSSGFRTVVATVEGTAPADKPKEASKCQENLSMKANTHKKSDKQARDFGVQVEPEDFKSEDEAKTDESKKKKKERRHKQVREFATQTSHAYFIWDTVY